MKLKSENINELAAALAKAQGEMEPAAFDKVNPHFKSRYASLAACVQAARPALAKHGLSVVQVPTRKDGGLVLVTTLLHTSGQWIEGEMPVTGTTPQQIGSALSYARRYSFSSAVGLVSDDDDDGEQASKPSPKAKQKPSEPVQTPEATGVAAAPNENSTPRTALPLGSPDYVIPIGKFRTKALKDVPDEQLARIVHYFLDQRAMGKPVDGSALDYLENAQSYLEKLGGGSIGMKVSEYDDGPRENS